MTEPLESKFVALQEFVTEARQQLGDNEWGYIVAVSYTHLTLPTKA